MAVPLVCMKYSLLNSNTLGLSTSSVMSQMPLMANVGIVFSNKALRRLASPSSCGALGYRAVSSMVRNIGSIGRGQRACSLSQKSYVSRMYDGILGTKG